MNDDDDNEESSFRLFVSKVEPDLRRAHRHVRARSGP
jgi:hypothetical protein